MLKCGTEKQTINSLFQSGGTVDIVIVKTTKNAVKCNYQNQNFTLNMHGVLCVESIIEQGEKVWYSFCPSSIPTKRIKESLKSWLENNNHNFAYTWKI